MAKKAVLEEQSLDSAFEQELAEAGLAGFFRKAIDREDMSVDCLSTYLPRLDKILHAIKLGLARGRRVEIYSRDPEVGKTSIALQIGVAWQRQKQKVAIVDIEDTITNDYLAEVGYDLNPSPESGMFPPYLAKGFDEETGEVLSAEEIADKVGGISRIVDLVIIDSIGALAKRADLEKEAGDATMGGIGKILWEHVRKNTHVRATSLWINQALPQIGVFSPAGIKYKTSGGAAIPFFASIRLELRLVEKLKANKDSDPYGVTVDVYTAKNKVSPPYKHVKLTYLDGEGFSPTWDLFEAALATKILEKSGSWIKFADHKWQGELNVYNAIRDDGDLRAQVQGALDIKNQETAAKE